MNTLPPCPQCKSIYTYEDNKKYICPECAHEWTPFSTTAEEVQRIWKDAHGNILQSGDSVIIIKDLKVKGATSDLKVGTKIKNIRLVDDDHDIDCKIDGFGSMKLKSEFVKKV